MKNYFFTMLAVIAGATSVAAQQITREQANESVLEYLQIEGIPYNLYVNTNPPSVEGISITTSNDETFKAKYACWAYYLNENESSRYLFVNADNANLLEVIANNDLGQSDLTQWELVEGSTDPEVGVVEKEGNSLQPLIYPNPVDDWLTFPVAGKRTRVEIHDAKGTRLYSELLTGENANQLDVSFLNSGVYIVSIYGETNLIYKFIKK